MSAVTTDILGQLLCAIGDVERAAVDAEGTPDLAIGQDLELATGYLKRAFANATSSMLDGMRVDAPPWNP